MDTRLFESSARVMHSDVKVLDPEVLSMGLDIECNALDFQTELDIFSKFEPPKYESLRSNHESKCYDSGLSRP